MELSNTPSSSKDMTPIYRCIDNYYRSNQRNLAFNKQVLLCLYLLVFNFISD